MKKILLILLLLFTLTGCKENETIDRPITDYKDLPYYEYLNETNPNVTIVFNDNSKIKIQLFPEIAPNTVNNFLELAEDNFYDGIIFHRVIEEFMIQGGDPEGTGMGGADYNIEGEFLQNDIENPLSHYRGVISMARSAQGLNTASSQFFIVHKTSAHLDGAYAGFGGVIEGFDILDKLAAVETDENDKPLEDIKIKDIIVDKKGVNYPESYKLNREFYEPETYLNEENPRVEITLSNQQIIEIELFEEVAPTTVANFITLVDDGFYNGLSIDRVFKDFVILAGEPTEGTDATDVIKGEFKINGHNNNLSHRKGVVSMFSIDPKNSTRTQFFIVVKDNIALDGSYAGFGYVVNGLDVIDSLNEVEVNEELVPTTDIIIESIKTK